MLGGDKIVYGKLTVSSPVTGLNETHQSHLPEVNSPNAQKHQPYGIGSYYKDYFYQQPLDKSPLIDHTHRTESTENS